MNRIKKLIKLNQLFFPEPECSSNTGLKHVVGTLFVMFAEMRTQASRDRPTVFRAPPERAEYTTESEVEESEFDQTRHNRCGLLRPTAYSDSDR